MSRTRRSRAPWDWYGGARPMSAGDHVYHVLRCMGKLAYKTKAKAMRAKRNKQRRFGVSYKVYHCPYCCKYHLTTHPWKE